MDWMYRGISGLVDREEYLKGRKIDKTFEIIEKEENNIKGDFESFDAQIPQSVFESNLNNDDNNNTQTVTVDLATKLREDPLYEIRIKQREQRRKLLDNPLKLKKLKNILESTLSEEKHSKHKKKNKRESSEESDKYKDKKHRNRDERKSYPKDSCRQTYSDRYKSKESYGEKDRDYNRKSHSNREYNRKDDKKYDNKNRFDNRKRTDNSKHNSRSYDSKHKSNKLSEEELEKKRIEMMNNAVWREVNRKSNVKSYKDKELEENKFNESAKSAQFIKPLLKSVTESDSLEKRIKQKRFTSQRSYNSMDTNFAKKS